MITPEEKMIRDMEEIAIKNANRPAEDKMAEMFTQYFPVFKSIVEGLGKRDLAQLCIELVKMPDGTSETFYHEKTQLASQLGGMLLNCKSVMLLKANLDALQEAYSRAQAEQEVASPSSSENTNVVQENKETVNG
jgi:hypothetical protein